MSKAVFKNAIMAFISLVLITNLFISCGDDDEPKVDPTDTTELAALITACDNLANSATTDDYSEASIATFKGVIAIAKTAVSDPKISPTAVANLVVQLTQAKEVFLASAYGAIPEAALLIGLSFDEGAGATLTAEGKKWVATLEKGPAEIFGTKTNLPGFVNGVKGKAIYFSNGSHLAINDYTATDLLGKELSVAVWVKPDSTRAGNYIASFNYWNSWKFQLQEQNKPFFTLKTDVGGTDADNEADFSAKNNEWTHLAVALNLTTKKLAFYVNGNLTKEWDSTSKPNLTGSLQAYSNKLPLMIGACTTYAEAKATWDWAWAETPESWDGFVGAMDEFKIYNIALTEGQVKKLYKDEK